MKKVWKRMKRKLGLFLVLVLAAGALGGCSSLVSAKEREGGNEEEPLKVAMDLKFPPFTGTDENGDPQGLEVDIAYALGEYLDREIEIVNTDFSMLITALETGEADVVISDMTVKEERKEKVDFSEPYLYGRTLALVNKEFAQKHKITNDMPPEEFFAIEGERVVGLAGTISVSVPQSFGVKVEEVTEIASALMEINQDKADVLVGANTILGDHAANADTTVVYEGIKEYSQSAMAVKKGNTKLLDQLNAFVETMYEEGGFYDEAGDRYDEAIGEYLQDESKGLEYIIYPPEGGVPEV
ncbi:MAG: transporter substrate-binding domain-containing protein [Ruminococcus sp.]|jgi:polar amino acid transport system substrate-binding protein